MSTARLPSPPPIQTLSRSESTPSNVSDSSTFVAAYPSFSPMMWSGQAFNASVDDVRELKRGMERLHTKQSLPNMSLDSASRQRLAVKPNVTIRPSNSRTAQSSPIVPSPASHETKSKGGFASFFKRLTGRSEPKTKSKPVNAPIVKQQTTPLPVRPNAVRSSSTSGASIKPVLEPLNMNNLRGIAAPFSAPAAPQPGAILSGPTPPTPQISVATMSPSDPRQIPLPPSPTFETMSELPETTSDIASLPPAIQGPGPAADTKGGSLRRAQPSGLLSMEESDEDTVEESEIPEVDESEEADQLPDLLPVRIPSGGSRYTAPDTPLSVNSAVEEIITPTSAGDNPLHHHGYKMPGGSPPKLAQTVSAPALERKESKWRKSIMGISDIGSKKSARNTTSTTSTSSRRDNSLERRAPRREPPTSYDSYVAHQQRIASRRASCQPTLHTQGSIAAELRQIRDKDESDMAEVFFLS